MKYNIQKKNNNKHNFLKQLTNYSDESENFSKNDGWWVVGGGWWDRGDNIQYANLFN